MKGDNLMAKKKYYAVAKGEKTGIFNSWDECKAYVSGYKGAVHHSFVDKETAKSWLIEKQIELGINIDDNVEEEYQEVYGLNVPIAMAENGDLPTAVEYAMLKVLGVSKLNELSCEMVQSIKDKGWFYAETSETDYHGRALSYMLLYLPVNFYKIWKPLLECLKNGRLVNEAKVLELGPGPGTATMSIMAFYAELALANPQEQFSLDITCIEREKDFISLFKELTNTYVCDMSTIPNLKIKKNIYRGDAFDFMYNEERHQYDIIIESNMLNNNECIDEYRLEVFVNGLQQNLRQKGIAIMIEPGTCDQKAILEDLVAKSTHKSSMKCLFGPEQVVQDNTHMSFLTELIDMGLRCKKNYQHWFTYTVLEMIE